MHELQKPLFAIVIADAALDAKVKELGKNALEQHQPQALAEFRKHVLSRTSDAFVRVIHCC